MLRRKLLHRRMRGRLRLLLTVALKDSPPSELGGESFRRPDRGKTPCAAVSPQSLSRFSIPVGIPIGALGGTRTPNRFLRTELLFH